MDPNGTFVSPYGQPMHNQYSAGGRPSGYYLSVNPYGPGMYPAVEDTRHSFAETGEIPLVQRKRQLSEAETVFRLLLPENQLGSVLNGSSDFQMPAGCRLRLCEKVPSCDERVIVLSAKDERKDDSNVAMQGLLSAVRRTLQAEQTLRENTRSINQFYMIRLLINRTQAGAVIGKGGILNKDIKEKTGAYSKILNSDEVPICALHNDRVVQVTGSVEQVMGGMQIIAKQLRDNVSKERPGGPPSCLSLLSGFTLYYAHEAPPYLPGTDYGRPRIMTTSIQNPPPPPPPNVGNPAGAGAGVGVGGPNAAFPVHPPPPPPNHMYSTALRPPGYVPFQRPSGPAFSRSPVIYTTNQTLPPYNGGPPVYYQ